jgi:multidrug resistance protein, MATE family
MVSGIRQELKPMVGLAIPVIVAEIGWTTMGLVDTLMVGPLGPDAIGGVGFGSMLVFSVGVFGMGLLLGLDTLVSQSYGAGRIDRCHHWLVQGLYLAALTSVPLTVLAMALIASLGAWGLAPDVYAVAVPYLDVVVLSLPVLLFYAAARRYLQAMNSVRPITFALVSANLVNAFVNWVLIYGKFGCPALGPAGAAWATVLSRVYMLAVLTLAIYVRDRRHRTNLHDVSWGFDGASQRRLFALGLPASLQITLEVGVFAAATALAGRLSAAALAAHQIALQLWSVVFMVPLGLNAAGAVRVGHAVGRHDGEGMRRAGWTALALGGAFSVCAAVVFLLAGRWLVSGFSTDATVLTLGPSLLAIAGVCLVFDGTQGIATGILRGLGETRIPMYLNLAGHWAIGLPLAYAACFWWGWGVQGLWVGLAVGLMLVGVALLWVWSRHTKAAVGHGPATAAHG